MVTRHPQHLESLVHLVKQQAMKNTKIPMKMAIAPNTKEISEATVPTVKP